MADRRSVLVAALGFALLAPREPELRLLHRWLDSWRGAIMMPALVAVSLCGVLIALPDAQAQASETCVKEARAALEVDSPAAFGPEAIVEGPKTIATVEREELANIAKCSHCHQTPFGYQYPEWEQFKRLIRPGDCLMFFRSNPYSWAHAFGSEGYVLVREGRIVEILATKIQ